MGEDGRWRGHLAWGRGIWRRGWGACDVAGGSESGGRVAGGAGGIGLSEPGDNGGGAGRAGRGERGERGSGGEVIGFFCWFLLGTNISAHRFGGCGFAECGDWANFIEIIKFNLTGSG
jgi:hypothetical protein